MLWHSLVSLTAKAQFSLPFISSQGRDAREGWGGGGVSSLNRLLEPGQNKV